MSIVLTAPAKINLTLEVLHRRDDGYHALRSVMVPIALEDRLEIAPASRFTFRCNVAELESNNLVVRAFELLGLRDAPLNVTLEKRIPTQAGLGGGSSDAAAIVIAAAQSALGDVPRADYLAVSRSLGSDVPFFLAQTAALVEGTGDRVTPLGAVPPWSALIVRPPGGISTAEAFARIDARNRTTRPRNESVSLKLAEALQRAEFETVVALLQNDFDDVVGDMHDGIATAKRALIEAGAQRAMLSGSGSCVFALWRNARAAQTAADRLTLPEGFARFVCPLLSTPAWRASA